MDTLKKWKSKAKPKSKVETIEGISTRSSIEFLSDTASRSNNSSTNSQVFTSKVEEIKYLSRLVQYGDEEAMERLLAMRQKS